MVVCTFFGHRDCPDIIKPKLREVLVDLIVNHGVDLFYVGQQGAFDRIVRTVLKELASTYSHIRYAVVLERMSQKQDDLDVCDYSNTILPEGIETVPPRFAIDRRNKWMLQQSDYVVTYVTHSVGGAAKFAAEAEKQKITIINLVL